MVPKDTHLGRFQMRYKIKLWVWKQTIKCSIFKKCYTCDTYDFRTLGYTGKMVMHPHNVKVIFLFCGRAFAINFSNDKVCTFILYIAATVYVNSV